MPTLLEVGVQRGPVDQLHREEHAPVVDADVVDGDDVGVAQTRHRLRLAQQACRARLVVVRRTIVHELQGDCAVELGIVGAVHDAHRPRAQLGHHHIAADDEILLVAEPLPSPANAAVTLVTGDMLSFADVAPDDSLPDFMIGPLVVPSVPTDAVAPDTLAIGESLTITWTPPPAASGDVLVELGQSPVGIERVRAGERGTKAA